MDKLLSAYGSIGVSLPRLARYGETFPDNYEFQQLLAYLYGDIIEFHTRAFRLIQKPGWKIFFSSGWGRFEHQFDALLQSIAQTSELIDKEAVSLDINLAQERRQKSLEDAAKQERRWESEQREVVLRWLEVGDSKSYQEDKLELLRSHCCEGTSQWLTKSRQVRSWLRFGKGHSVLWLHGKPGSGKSVLCSQLIYFLRSDPNRNCLFFFCDFHTKSYAVTAQVLRSLCVQIIDLAPELTSFIYDECVITGSNPSVSCLKAIVPKLMTAFKDIRVIIDGIDEVGYSQHRELIKTLASLAETQDNCKILFSSQNIPTIFSSLKNKPQLPLGAESASVAKDIDLIVAASLEELNQRHGGRIPETVLAHVRKLILERAEGMFLWVSLVLEILKGDVSVEDLQSSVECLPEDLAGAYNKILTNITRSSSTNNLSKQRRVFGWMLFAKGNKPLRKHELRLAMTLHSESCLVSMENKPFPNALDICYPFIEDGPRGSVVFIHSTVPKFLLDHSYGPFINEADSHRDISVACLGQLLQSFYLVAERSVSSQLYRQTGQGFHALLPYAIEYWAEHLLDYFERVPEVDSYRQSQVTKKLLDLCHEHDRISGALGWGEAQYISDFKPSKEDHRLDCLKSFPVAFNLLNCFMHFRQAANATKEQPSSSPDPTLFWSIRQEYHKAVVHLMTQQSCPGLTPEELMVFKEEFGSTAFVCHVRGCEQSVVGYSTANALRDHEARHRGVLKCFEPACFYNDIGFSSSKQLRTHTRKRHSAVTAMELPQQICQKRPRESRESPIDEQDPQPGGPINGNPQQMGMPLIQNPQAIALMDSMDLPPQVLQQLSLVPPEVKKWGGLKMWLNQNNVGQQVRNQLAVMQQKQFQLLLQRRPNFMSQQQGQEQSQQPQPQQQQAQQLPQPGQNPNANTNMQTPGGAGPNPLQAMRAQAPANFPAHILQVTPQEMAQVRNSRPNFANLPDDQLRMVAQQMKKATWIQQQQMRHQQAQAQAQTARGQGPGQGQQGGQNQMGVPQAQMQLQQPPQPNQTPQPQNMQAPNAMAQNVTPQGAGQKQPSATPEQTRGPRQQPAKSRFQPPIPSPAPAPKNLKRPSDENADVAEPQKPTPARLASNPINNSSSSSSSNSNRDPSPFRT